MSEPVRPVSELERDPAEDSDQPNDVVDEPTVRVIDKRWWARESNATDSEGSDGESGRPAYVEELKQRLADLERKLSDKDALLADYAGKYKDAARDFEQTRDRLRRELAKDVERETRRVLSSFLEVVDNLDRAIDAATREDEAPDGGRGRDAMLEGVRLVREQFLATLERYDVKPLDADGQPFDPNLHDALSTVPVTDAAQDNVVVTVVKPGYVVNGDVLRPASVIVGKHEG